jgi:hypothetical protein
VINRRKGIKIISTDTCFTFSFLFILWTEQERNTGRRQKGGRKEAGRRQEGGRKEAGRRQDGGQKEAGRRQEGGRRGRQVRGRKETGEEDR